jgi:UDP-N-acetylmuramoyl-tripeptide--D-alanyl-D-alanine ligase
VVEVQSATASPPLVVFATETPLKDAAQQLRDAAFERSMEIARERAGLPPPSPLMRRLRRSQWSLQVRGTCWRAWLWRRLLWRAHYVGVTGSCGKTTAKEYIYGVLATQGPGQKNPGSFNIRLRVAQQLLRMRRRHTFLVQEVGMSHPGSICESARLLRPTVGVVTMIGLDHYSQYRSREAIAAEKSALIRALPRTGLAVLNADDDLVLAMREVTAARVITYGTCAAADVRATDVVGDWPGCLRFRVTYGGECVPVQTRLLGRVALHSVLAGMACGVGMGVSLQQAARAVAHVEQLPSRMEPHVDPQGVTFVLDDWKAPAHSLPPVFAFLETATANRKIMIIGTISDYAGGSERRFRRLAEHAAAVADHVFFVGRHARYALKAKRPNVEAFEDVESLSGHLGEFLQKDDLVVVKGSNRADHLTRLLLHRQHPITCWRMDCGLKMCLVSRICGYARAPGGHPLCERVRFSAHRSSESRRIFS